MPRTLALVATLGLLLVASLATGAPAAAGGGCHAAVNGDVHTDGEASTIRMDTCSFGPTVARVPIGTEVTFLNTAQNEHVVLGRGSTWGGQSLQPGQQFVQAFAEPGVFPYSCPLHPGMVGAIVVGGDAPVAAAPVAEAAVEEPSLGSPAEAVATGAPDPLVTAGLGVAIGLSLAGIGALAIRRRSETEPAGT